MTPRRQRMIDDMRIRNLAPATSYLGHVSLFARHFGRSPQVLGSEDSHAEELARRSGRYCLRAAGRLCALAAHASRFIFRRRDEPTDLC
jgi:hypothetical protein